MRTSSCVRVACGLLLLGQLGRAASDASHLRSGAAARHKARGLLRTEAAKLAEAFRWAVAPESSGQRRLEALRNRFAEQMENLEQFDGRSASLIRNYARHVQPTLLLMPTPAWGPSSDGGFIIDPEEAPEAPAGPEDAPPNFGDARPGLAESTEETVVRRDSQGRTVTSTRRCKDGHCVERTEVGVAPGGSLEARNAGSSEHNSEGPLQEQEVPPPPGHRRHHKEGGDLQHLTDAVRGMAASMRTVEKSIGRDGLRDVLDEIFKARSKSHSTAPAKPLEEEAGGEAAPQQPEMEDDGRPEAAQARPETKRPEEGGNSDAGQREEGGNSDAGQREESHGPSAAATAAAATSAGAPHREPPAGLDAQRGREADAGDASQGTRVAVRKDQDVTSESTSTEVIVENGKILKRSRQCKNGLCITKVEEGHTGGEQHSAGGPDETGRVAMPDVGGRPFEQGSGHAAANRSVVRREPSNMVPL